MGVHVYGLMIKTDNFNHVSVKYPSDLIVCAQEMPWHFLNWLYSYDATSKVPTNFFINDGNTLFYARKINADHIGLYFRVHNIKTEDW